MMEYRGVLYLSNKSVSGERRDEREKQPNNMDEKSLTQKQEKALELVVRGCSDVEVARRVGVSRQIINRWRNHDTGFQYELEMRRQAVREKHQDKMNELVEQALEVVGQALGEGDEKTRLQTAMFVLRMSGLQASMGRAKRGSRAEMEKELVENTLFQVVQEMGWVE
jgi:hypothetical protein